jgi:prephenate dehydrogenase
MPAIRQVAICGVGLIGASFGLALRRDGFEGRIAGSSRRTVTLAEAKRRGAIDEGFPTAEEAADGSDLILLCAPVPVNVDLLKRVAQRLKPGAIITDVGSTKQTMVAAAREIFGRDWNRFFLPGHPMAGKESSGPANAEASLFAGATWLFTPEADAKGKLPSEEELFNTPVLNEFHRMLQRMGARILLEDPATHDHVLAYVSHLPQLLSTALAATVMDAIGDEKKVGRLMGGGLRGMLRLAASDPAMWAGVAQTNRANIAEALEGMENELRRLRLSLGDESFRAEFERARSFRPESREKH